MIKLHPKLQFTTEEIDSNGNLAFLFQYKRGLTKIGPLSVVPKPIETGTIPTQHDKIKRKFKILLCIMPVFMYILDYIFFETQ